MSVMSVTQLNKYIAFKIGEDKKLKGIMVKGEISNFKCHTPSGHLYFALTEPNALIRGVMFAGNASKLPFMPEDGMEVIVIGNVSVYEKDGTYRLYVTDMQPCGEGAKYLGLKQLKSRLAAAGVFSPSKKKPIPRFPKEIGVITSASGAALQDITAVLQRRYQMCTLRLFAAAVQGENAENEIAGAIEAACRHDLDVIILARGGGSAEDLSAFNTEKVALAVHSAGVPVISAIGHETDYTLADLAADMRVPTPSAAAEITALDLTQVLAGIEHCAGRIYTSTENRIQNCEMKLSVLTSRLQSPESTLNLYAERLAALETRIYKAKEYKFNAAEKELSEQASRLEALSPLKILTRGYSITYKDGKPVTDAALLSAGDTVAVKFSKGEIKATVKESENGV
ncbi:MAG: exodeoxyribonuclease VII large subunit [Oscillospiraceae bacterium]|jgi:exodeoxyribonuclease VII large subunit|nr:exodeoxyribonuclease VII large subunit [Oscillospiraceae bacterium]